MLRLILTAILIILLSACQAVGPGPGIALVEQAIAMQVSQTQQQLVRQLGLSQPPELEITRIGVKKREPLVIEDLQAFRLRGNYDLKIKLPAKENFQRNKPFDVYLQRQKQAQTWRLAIPAGNENEQKWTTYLIEPVGYQ
ncbi:MAG: hypothetical protein AB1861_27055 [Cyanobacteriota bacterium]